MKTKAKSKKLDSKTKKEKIDDEEEETSGNKSLVIVESPGKVKTISKFLGKDFIVRASIGHVRDLPEKGLGIDVKNKFEPIYEILEDKQKVVKELQEIAKKSEKIYLAPDPDREGEAIAWHLSEILGKPKKTFRIECNEITKDAVKNAIKHPREINKDLVEAQQARRILDRLVGYKISPVLWRKIGGRSAGRVQSVALRLVVEREREINAFISEEYWSVSAEFKKNSNPFKATLYSYDGKTIITPKNKENKNSVVLRDKESVDKILKDLSESAFQVTDIEQKESQRNPFPPFITSTLQRSASNLFGYPVKKVMKIAQELYEGIEIGEEGPVGLITYMRTDSTRISKEAQDECHDYIVKTFGKEYYPDSPRFYKSKAKNVQDAHEAIRPTSVFRNPSQIKKYLSQDQYKVYRLIWERFLASQMASVKLLINSVEISGGKGIFYTKATEVIFEGFLKAFGANNEDKAIEEDEEKETTDILDEEITALPDLKIKDKVNLNHLDPKQHFTEPPPRFNEASLVKKLEELGIGRPSTYASTVSTILDRKYVQKLDKKAFSPTKLGEMVTNLLMNHFTKYVDYDFTARMEANLDEIEEAKQKWEEMISDFYEPFSKTLKDAQTKLQNEEIKTEHNCPSCGKVLLMKGGRFGPFLGCSGYPDCKTVVNLTKDGEPVPQAKETEEKCPKCSTSMLLKHGRFGEYFQCKNEECKHTMTSVKSTGIKCPREGCDGEIIEKKSRRGKIFYGCSSWSKTKCNSAFWTKPIPEKCPKCSSYLTLKILSKSTNIQCTNSKECDYKREPTQEEIEKYK